jgi:hypothetical protein
MKFLPLASLFLAVWGFFPAEKSSASAALPVAGDKYMYPFFNDTQAGGKMPYASVFGAFGSSDDPKFDFDDRDAQFFLDFNTTTIAPVGRGASNYRVLNVTVTIVAEKLETVVNGFRYDPTLDQLAHYLNPSNDIDQGRPIELYGVGYRSNWTRASFNADSPFQDQPSSSISNPQRDWNRKRNAFALDFASNGTPRDISNNVEEQFEVNPWAVADSPGEIDLEGNYIPSALTPGSFVQDGRVFRFQVNVSNPHILAYLQDSFNAGRLHLMVSSLYDTSQSSPDVPRFYSLDHEPLGYYLGPAIEADVVVMPSPTVSQVAGGYRVSFDTISGQNYQVEFRDSLISGTWQPLGTLRSGNGSTLTHDDTSAGSREARYYRVSVSK